MSLKTDIAKLFLRPGAFDGVAGRLKVPAVVADVADPERGREGLGGVG